MFVAGSGVKALKGMGSKAKRHSSVLFDADGPFFVLDGFFHTGASVIEKNFLYGSLEELLKVLRSAKKPAGGRLQGELLAHRISLLVPCWQSTSLEWKVGVIQQIRREAGISGHMGTAFLLNTGKTMFVPDTGFSVQRSQITECLYEADLATYERIVQRGAALS